MNIAGRILVAAAAVSAVPMAATAELTQWPGNGHYYETVAADGITWPAASTAAAANVNLETEGLRCYLATLTSAPEDQFVDALRLQTPGINTSGGFPDSELWAGGFQDPPSADEDDAWFWVNDEGSFSYTNWLPNEPNDDGGDERFLAIGWSGNSGWNDEASLGGIFGYVRECDVVVQANDDGPVAATSGVAEIIDVVANDVIAAGDFTVSIEDSPGSTGSLAEVLPDETIRYTSGTAFEGTDTFTYRVTDASGAYAVATVTVEVSADEAVVDTGTNQLIFNQAKNPSPDSNNPMTAAYQEVLDGGEVKISCCRVLDTREIPAAGRKPAKFKPVPFDLGRAVADTVTNPSCADMPHIARGSAVLRPWQRGVPRSQGFIDTDSDIEAREHDLGVCVIEADVDSRGVVFSAEEASNVLGFGLNGAVESIRYRPFTGGVSLDPEEVDAPWVTPWTAEWDESRSGKRFSDNLMVINLWHEWLLLPSVPYLLQLVSSLEGSIGQVKAAGCVENNAGFLDDLASLVQSAKVNIALAAIPWWRESFGSAAVANLDDATRLAMLIGPDAPSVDPYGMCPGNPEGLFVGRSMALKFAACSELLHPFDSASSLDGACKIEEDILCELPELPGFDHPDCN